MDYASYKCIYKQSTPKYACVTRIMTVCSFVRLFLWAGSWVGWPTSGCSLLLHPVGFRVDLKTIQPKDKRRVCTVVEVSTHQHLLPAPFRTLLSNFVPFSLVLSSFLPLPLPSSILLVTPQNNYDGFRPLSSARSSNLGTNWLLGLGGRSSGCTMNSMWGNPVPK